MHTSWTIGIEYHLSTKIAGIHMQQYYMGIKFDKCTVWESSPTVQLSDVCIEKYSSTISSQALSWLASWSCFNFWLVSLMSKHCVAGNMSQKEAFSSSPSSFKLLCISECLQCLSVRAETAGAVLLFMSSFSRVSTTKQSIKKGKINHSSCQSTEWKVAKKCLGKLMNFFSLLQLWLLWTWQKKVAYTIFPLCLPLVSISSSSIALPHFLCCGPLGCLSTARSDFDICWNAQWSVQAWKDIQCFDPKPLVSFSSPFPFHQKLLCDIVHWHVGSQTKAWIYLNFHQWKTSPPIVTPTHIHAHRHICVCTHHTVKQKHTDIQNTKRAQCETTTIADLHFQWDFNILWAHQRQESWGESSSGESLLITWKQSQHPPSIKYSE